MSNIILERLFNEPISHEDYMHMVQQGLDCMPLYRVSWHESLRSSDGTRLVCRFDAPDAEAVRMVARHTSSPKKVTWTGTVHDSPDTGEANVVVERDFEQAMQFEDIEALEKAGAWCLETHGVTFLRSFFSVDGKRMICLYRAPDAEAVRRAQQQAAMPVSHIWACHNYLPHNLKTLLSPP
jgi:Nickel responsive protein SCO4226-like